MFPCFSRADAENSAPGISKQESNGRICSADLAQSAYLKNIFIGYAGMTIFPPAHICPVGSFIEIVLQRRGPTEIGRSVVPSDSVCMGDLMTFVGTRAMKGFANQLMRKATHFLAAVVYLACPKM